MKQDLLVGAGLYIIGLSSVMLLTTIMSLPNGVTLYCNSFGILETILDFALLGIGVIIGIVLLFIV
jgi:hypothetical protein